MKVQFFSGRDRVRGLRIKVDFESEKTEGDKMHMREKGRQITC